MQAPVPAQAPTPAQAPAPAPIEPLEGGADEFDELPEEAWVQAFKDFEASVDESTSSIVFGIIRRLQFVS